ncbi:MAG TPA: hemolysin family protein [Pirellulaceae bacterium]|nr:hemolysin family protein [Pirellulaceae bacterium]
MSTAILLAIAIIAAMLAALTANAAKVLHEFSRSELQSYCRRRDRLDRFGQILDNYEQTRLGLESLQFVAIVIAIAASAAWFFHRLNSLTAMTPLVFVAGVAVLSVVVLALAIWIPTAVAELWAPAFLFHLWRPLWWMSRLMRPLNLGAEMIDALVRRLADRPESDEDEEEAFEDDIRSLVTEGQYDGVLEQDAREMIEGVIELADTDVSDIMTPRSNMDALEVTANWDQVLQYVVEAGRTRFPVFEGPVDQIIGVLYVKDLLAELALEESQRKSMRELLRQPWFVPTTRPLDELLQDFLQTRNHLAVVVDEYQSVAGVVTIEDVLEEIVGEIVDESDKDEEEVIRIVDDTSAEVLGIAHVDDLNERLGLDLPEPDEYDTIAGFVIHELGRIPKAGETMLADGAKITVLAANRRRIERLLVETQA